MIILVVYIIPYLAVSTIVMVIAIKYTKKIWIRGIVAAVLFLIPTYDIIITNILGVYYCTTAPKAFIKETVEYPESIYFEDNVFNGFNEQDIENMMNNYLDGIHLKTLALNLPDGNVAIYHYKKNQDEYDKIVKEVKQELGDKTSHYDDIRARIIKIIDSNKIITTKDKMPKMNYTVLDDKVNLNQIASKFFYADIMRIINNKTGETISYQQRYFSFGTDIIDVPFKGEYVCGDISLVAATFPKMDLNIGYVLVNFDRKLENNPKGVKK
ncbi:MAG: hypothetical protein ACLVCW_05305 [Campylobacter sp.]